MMFVAKVGTEYPGRNIRQVINVVGVVMSSLSGAVHRTNYQQKDVHKVSFVEQMNMSKW